MDEQEFRRRCMEQWGVNPDKYEGFGFGMMFWNGSNQSPQFAIRVCLTPMVATPVGHSISFVYGWRQNQVTSSSMSLAWFDANGNYKSYNDQRPNGRTLTAAQPFVRMSFDFDRLADSYIYDNTTGEYLWRGLDYI